MATDAKMEAQAHDIAVRIYVELVARNTEIHQDSVKLTASAANMAMLSLRLSDAFMQAEAEALVQKEPKKAHALQGEDIASWMK